ncbi:MAG: four helix bundle protein [Bacteroidota bacterium]|nr:four helix bundle protein [Bacteroidota bacterium]
MTTWKTFEEIECWQLARSFCTEIYKNITQYKGLNTDYALKRSNRIGPLVASWITSQKDTDGGGTKELLASSIAKGSASESRSQLYRVLDRQYIDQEKHQELQEKTRELINKIVD